MEYRLTGVAEAVPVARWYDHGLPSGQGSAFLTNPNFGAASQDGQYLLDRVKMRRRAATKVTPLLEDTQLLGTRCSRNAHARENAEPPQLPLLSPAVDDAHCLKPGPSR